MALKAIISSLDEAGEQSSLYKQSEDGNYILDVVPVDGFSLENVHGLKSALGKERKRATDYEAKLKQFDGLDINEALNALSEVDKYKQFDPSKEADKIASEKFKSLESQLKQKHDEDLSVLNERLGSVISNYEKITVEAEAAQAIAKLGGNVKLLFPHVKSQVKTSLNDDGSVSYTVVDEYGNPRIGDSKGSAMTVEQLVAEMRSSDEFAPAFKANNASGGGASRSASSAAYSGNGNYTPLQKIASGLGNL